MAAKLNPPRKNEEKAGRYGIRILGSRLGALGVLALILI